MKYERAEAGKRRMVNIFTLFSGFHMDLGVIWVYI
jgi:hypothetical protein